MTKTTTKIEVTEEYQLEAKCIKCGEVKLVCCNDRWENRQHVNPTCEECCGHPGEHE